ncbi:MAG: sigma factor [Ginsengibacter sp.]
MYDVYASALFGYILKIVADKEKAENILEFIFINLSRTIENYNDGRGSLFIWLLNTARNKSIEALGVKPQISNTYQSELSLLEKTIFSLINVGGLKANEISDLLHLPLKTIKAKFDQLYKFKQLEHEKTGFDNDSL